VLANYVLIFLGKYSGGTRVVHPDVGEVGQKVSLHGVELGNFAAPGYIREILCRAVNICFHCRSKTLAATKKCKQL
jgi:hypothetical protein